MLLRDIDNYYLKKEEPVKSCLLALREWILQYNEHFSEAWKYRMPCFCYKGKMFCYLWIDKKLRLPYILIVEGAKIDHPLLVQGDRARMKIMYIEPNEDLPIKELDTIFKMVIQTIQY